MTFQQKMSKAAHRNREAADRLESGPRRDVAGYLYGISAECAVKEMVRTVPLLPGISRDQIYYAHFPELRSLVREAIQGRSGQPLMKLVGNDDFMNQWHISMRYAESSQILDTWVDRWRDQARLAATTMGS